MVTPSNPNLISIKLLISQKNVDIKKTHYNDLKDRKLILSKPKIDKKTGYTLNPDLNYELDWNKNPGIGIEKRKAMMKKPGKSFKFID